MSFDVFGFLGVCFLFVVGIAGAWGMTIEFCRHGFSCWHKWEKWEDNTNGTQIRFCKKCNMAEKRTP